MLLVVLPLLKAPYEAMHEAEYLNGPFQYLVVYVDDEWSAVG